jgi:hypothetical protein
VRATTNGPWFSGKQKVADGTKKLTLRNLAGALPAGADVYTWGLSDPQDASKTLADTGYDIRAVGVQSFPDGDDTLMVFAMNMHHRWSNAAANEYDIVIDSDRDGTPDWIVLSADSGGCATATPTACPRCSSSTPRRRRRPPRASSRRRRPTAAPC